jgi:hypothetical protein
MVGLVAAVTLTLFTAVYAQQVAPPQEDDAAEVYFDDREEFD